MIIVKKCKVLQKILFKYHTVLHFVTLSSRSSDALRPSYCVFQIVKEYTFLDYIMGGCQINFTVSNTDVSDGKLYSDANVERRFALFTPL